MYGLHDVPADGAMVHTTLTLSQESNYTMYVITDDVVTRRHKWRKVAPRTRHGPLASLPPSPARSLFCATPKTTTYVCPTWSNLRRLTAASTTDNGSTTDRQRKGSISKNMAVGRSLDCRAAYSVVCVQVVQEHVQEHRAFGAGGA